MLDLNRLLQDISMYRVCLTAASHCHAQIFAQEAHIPSCGVYMRLHSGIFGKTPLEMSLYSLQFSVGYWMSADEVAAACSRITVKFSETCVRLLYLRSQPAYLLYTFSYLESLTASAVRFLLSQALFRCCLRVDAPGVAEQHFVCSSATLCPAHDGSDIMQQQARSCSSVTGACIYRNKSSVLSKHLRTNLLRCSNLWSAMRSA